MPIHDFRYRELEGPRRPSIWRWWPITRVGIQLAWTSKMLRRLIYFGWAPLLYFGVIFFGIGWATDRNNIRQNSDFATGILAMVTGMNTGTVEAYQWQAMLHELRQRGVDIDAKWDDPAALYQAGRDARRQWRDERRRIMIVARERLGGKPGGDYLLAQLERLDPPAPNNLLTRFKSDPESLRPVAWSMAFYYFFAFTQSWIAMLVVCVVGPGLIARDIRTRAYLVYFAKPIGRAEYIVGKAGIVMYFLLWISLLPALVLYFISIMFSPSLGALVETFPVVLKIIKVSLVIAVPITLIVLLISSLTNDERYAMFGWLALCLLGEMCYRALAASPQFQDQAWIAFLSLRHVILAVTWHEFDVAGQMREIGTSPSVERFLTDTGTSISGADCEAFLLVLSVVCLVVLLRRVTAPLRV